MQARKSKAQTPDCITPKADVPSKGDVPSADKDNAHIGRAAPPIRVGFTATKKIGNAVVRNRAKRRLREVARAVLPRYGQPGFDYVFIARGSTALRPFEKLLQDAEKAVLSLSSNPDSHAQSKPR